MGKKDVLGESPGDIKNYPKGNLPNLKKMPDGNPYPYELGSEAEDGISDTEKVDGFNSERNYKPSAEEQNGEDGLGGHK